MEQAERFADPLDEAANLQERMVELAIANVRNQPKLLKPKGTCHWCREKVADLKLFCDTDCNHDYEKHKQNQR